jgi:hypothetical protein
LGQAGATTLRGSMGHDALPVRLAPGSPFAGQVHSGAGTDHGHDTHDAQFHRLLQRKIHAFPTRDALQQGNVKGGFPERGDRLPGQPDLSILALEACDLSPAFPAFPVEQDHFGAYRQPQHAAQVMDRFTGQGDKCPGFQGCRDPKARNPHG